MGCMVLTFFPLRPTIYTRSQGWKKLGANFEQLWLVVWPQVTNKCYNIDVRILINAGTLAPKGCKLASQIQWYPFFSLGASTRP